MTIHELRSYAAGGDRDAMFKLGLHLCRGVGVPRDCAEGAAWFERAAQLGDVEAMFCAGGAYSGGYEEDDQAQPLDLSRAAYWTLAAADRGYVRAYERAGFCLEHGVGGVRRDATRAVQFYLAAARLADPTAAAHLKRLGIPWTL
jgi:TPR repeat protein